MTEITEKKTPLVTFPLDEMVKLVKSFTSQKLASLLDVTDLKADTQEPKILKMAEWAKSLNCASVCVNPVDGSDILPLALKGSKVKECYVIDFPLGKLDIEMKSVQTSYVVKKSRELRGEGKGKMELDMVINVGRFKKDPNYALEEINAVCEAADGEPVKVIVRSSELTVKEIYTVSEIVARSKAAFIKNSTGMDAYGALPEHMKIMREVVGNKIGVKSSGGVSDAATAMRLIYASARDESLQKPELFRIGTSSPLNIVSTFGWLAKAPEHWLGAGIIPCKICPFYHNTKLRVELREEANSWCRQCIHNHYLVNKDF
ncbi:MAG: deoxyribose-phosphate aldolase [Bacteroidetes bacterium]|nr:deoxyribose-phosphate aldolase [Bacteroidota bacterium]